MPSIEITPETQVNAMINAEHLTIIMRHLEAMGVKFNKTVAVRYAVRQCAEQLQRDKG